MWLYVAFGTASARSVPFRGPRATNTAVDCSERVAATMTTASIGNLCSAIICSLLPPRAVRPRRVTVLGARGSPTLEIKKTRDAIQEAMLLVPEQQWEALTQADMTGEGLEDARRAIVPLTFRCPKCPPPATGAAAAPAETEPTAVEPIRPIFSRPDLQQSPKAASQTSPFVVVTW
eukprot:COSAG01_NODE_243_length_20572_cov_24.956137_14_plen_176_part_00